MTKSARAAATAALAALVLGGCSAPRGVEIGPPDPIHNPKPGIFGEGGLKLFGGASGRRGAVETLGVNAYLWRAALDTLSILPLASADPLGGAVTTDWGRIGPNPNERVKATAYVKSAELSANALEVVINRQVSDGVGGWRDAPVAADTARRLEDAILLRARQIRIQETGR
ncbi:DUF3576 domain-containing protein [Neomegalonema sp.]|uniref:DUF3576 domain-containing protein n=1 Tax=Neomegalonema sp. TaxID=2039713 RepID=UPI0026344D7B|nr:DUF3576 domain-containing protein [Neomegalonema sp.]MDD2867235.1 DUF3576 domain-containing protein [Neomegalonema sp.]